jgi:hypothetical protein
MSMRPPGGLEASGSYTEMGIKTDTTKRSLNTVHKSITLRKLQALTTFKRHRYHFNCSASNRATYNSNANLASV